VAQDAMLQIAQLGSGLHTEFLNEHGTGCGVDSQSVGLAAGPVQRHHEVSSKALVAVIGVPHAKWGETVKALVVPADNTTTTERELIDYCKSKLAGYKCPTSVEFRTELARTATGKLQKYKLREPFWVGMTRQVN